MTRSVRLGAVERGCRLVAAEPSRGGSNAARAIRRRTLAYGVALLCASSAACDSGSTDTAAAPGDAGADGFVSSVAGRTLTISLDPTIDADDGDSKATSITSADLLDPAGRTAAHATLVSGSAVFGVAGVGAGDDFVKINGDGDDLVPTRLDDATANVSQRIGQKRA